MRSRHLAVATLTALAALGAAAGCSTSETAATTTTTTSTTTTSRPRDFAVDTPNGQVSLSLDGKLPPNWPTSFPVPPGATPAGSGSLGGTSQGVMVAVYTTTQSASDAFAFYKNDTALTTNASSTGVGNAFAGKASLTGTYAGSVSVVGRDSTFIIVVLTTTGTTGGTTPGTSPGTTTSSGSTPGTTRS